MKLPPSEYRMSIYWCPLCDMMGNLPVPSMWFFSWWMYVMTLKGAELSESVGCWCGLGVWWFWCTWSRCPAADAWVRSLCLCLRRIFVVIPGNLIHLFLTASYRVVSAADAKVRLKNSTRSPTVSCCCALRLLTCCCGTFFFRAARCAALSCSAAVIGSSSIIHKRVLALRLPVKTTVFCSGSTM